MSNSSKAEKIARFDPSGVGNTGGNIFGLPFTTQEAEVVIIPVPWDVTVSNLDGTAGGPQNILDQSPQIDLYDEITDDPWKAGIAMEEISEELISKNNHLRSLARHYISNLEENRILPEAQEVLNEINHECHQLSELIRSKSLKYLSRNQLVVLTGGDHSTPLGLIKAMAEHHGSFGILQIDAHADLRDAYMGFTHSHASIIHNASKIASITSVVQLGLRDISKQEAEFINTNERFHPFFARDLHRRNFEGENWRSVCLDIISRLPEKVYITFDIDGLDPSQCSSTGTPVPGGLSYDAVLYLFELMVKEGKTIIGFDLVETGKNYLDGIVACRILYKTIALMLKSNKRI